MYQRAYFGYSTIILFFAGGKNGWGTHPWICRPRFESPLSASNPVTLLARCDCHLKCGCQWVWGFASSKPITIDEERANQPFVSASTRVALAKIQGWSSHLQLSCLGNNMTQFSPASMLREVNHCSQWSDFGVRNKHFEKIRGNKFKHFRVHLGRIARVRDWNSWVRGSWSF